jgi:hypothetical protein
MAMDHMAHERTDEQLANLLDSLVLYPNTVKRLMISGNRLTDVSGVKVAKIVATSSTIEDLKMSHNQFSEVTYFAIADALRTNTSLRELLMGYNRAVDRTAVDVRFTGALQHNPHRPPFSYWELYETTGRCDRDRLLGE